jgi:hypothetical protein
MGAVGIGGGGGGTVFCWISSYHALQTTVLHSLKICIVLHSAVLYSILCLYSVVLCSTVVCCAVLYTVLPSALQCCVLYITSSWLVSIPVPYSTTQRLVIRLQANT